MLINTGRTLKDGTEIMVRDIIKSAHAIDLIVICDKETNEYMVQAIEGAKISMTLDEFLNDNKKYALNIKRKR